MPAPRRGRDRSEISSIGTETCDASSDHRRRREAPLRRGRERRAAHLRPRVRGRLALVGTAAASFRPALSLHRLQRARVHAVRCARRCGEILAGPCARRHQSRDGCLEDRQGAHRRSVDGWICDAAFRIHLSRARIVAGHRRLRLRRIRRQACAVRGGNRGRRPALRRGRHEQGGHGLRARAVARAVPEQGPARLAGVRRPARGKFNPRRGADHAWACRSAGRHCSTWSIA